MRYKLTIAYRGTRYHGWQYQLPNALYKGPKPPEGHGIPTVQETLERAIGSIVHHPVRVVGSSRTDAGVHAKGQLAVFNTSQTKIPPEGLRRAVNHALPDDILVRTVEPVPDDFDVITCTTSKRYQYFIWYAPDRPVHTPDLAWHRWKEMDIDAMRAATAYFVGEHDFASFARPRLKRDSTVRRVTACQLSHRGPRLIIGVEGTGFLWNMVRIMVGTLVEVGLGRYQPQDVARMIEARDRRAAGPTAPPHGLYLQWVRTRDDARPASPDDHGS
jgi:tRNA pseudouridine38-40 synthase